MRVNIYIKYFLFLYLLAISSFEFFFRVNQQALYLLVPMVTVGFFYHQKKIDFTIFLLILPFVLVYLLQTFFYGSPFYFALTLAIRLLTIYMAVKLIGEDFMKIFIQSIKYFSILSLFLYAFQNFGGFNILMGLSTKFTNLGSDILSVIDRPNLVLYTIQTEKAGLPMYRNSGPFWEPGLYAVYLNISLFLNLFIKKRILHKTNLLFIICIITTFSTTGFIALLLNLTLFGLLNKSVSLPARIIMIFFLLISIPSIFALPFMSDKISNNINASDKSYSRFGAAIVHWEIVKDFPITGMPSGEEFMAKFYSKYADNISPNGITVMFTRYGVFVGFFYFFLLYRSASTIMNILGEKNKGYALFMILVIVLFSQTQGNTPIYWAFIFFQFPLSDYLLKWERFKKIRLYNYYLRNNELNSIEE